MAPETAMVNESTLPYWTPMWAATGIHFAQTGFRAKIKQALPLVLVWSATIFVGWIDYSCRSMILREVGVSPIATVMLMVCIGSATGATKPGDASLAQARTQAVEEQTERKQPAPPGPVDGFGQIAAEMERVNLKRSAALLNSNRKTVNSNKKTVSGCADTPRRKAGDETRIARARAQVSAVIAKAARPDLLARVSDIVSLLQQLEADIDMIRSTDSLTPATKALVELSLLKEREALLKSAGLKPTPVAPPAAAQDTP